MTACLRCAEPLQPGDRWCTVCFRRVVEVDEQEPGAELAATVGNRRRWTTPATYIGRPALTVYSRTPPGPLSVGLAGRSILTALLVIAAMIPAVFISWHPLFRGVMSIPLGLATFLGLRAFRRRARIA